MESPWLRRRLSNDSGVLPAAMPRFRMRLALFGVGGSMAVSGMWGVALYLLVDKIFNQGIEKLHADFCGGWALYQDVGGSAINR